MIIDAESILRVCGIDTYLHIGCGHSSLVFELLKRAIDAYGMDDNDDLIKQHQQRAPDRFFKGSLANFPLSHVAFGTVIIGAELFQYNEDDISAVLNALQSIIKHNLVLYFPPDRPAPKNRLFWEKAAIQADFRRHPRSMLVTPYPDLENETAGQLIFFEKTPSSITEYQHLSTDMLRETGRRADGSISRYVLAATRIRPGDVVLDAGCGLGYGTAVLAACSSGSRFIGVDRDANSIAYANANYAANNTTLNYQMGDVTRLSFLPDHSVDAIVAFDIIEQLPDIDVFLAEMRRVLKPDGRFIGSVPNQWCDEAGNALNADHVHVFNWKNLHDVIAKHFIIDDRWSQTAGGGFNKMRNGRRMILPIPLQLTHDIDTEWWIISACADPIASRATPFTNPFHKENSPIPPLVDFAKYYDNPWLYRTMVQLGERISDRLALFNFCAKISVEAKTGSADQGAALCVLGYQLLESGHVTLDDTLSLINRINQYDAAYDRQNIHAYRWALSLHYIGGRLLLALGKHQDAKTAFLTCAAMDPLIFSPLLATKTISSRMYTGLLYFSENRVENAKAELRLAIREAHRVLQGNWESILGSPDHPLLFGLQEAAEVLNNANQCAQFLHAIDREGSTAGIIWEKINLKCFGLVEWNKSLERENKLLRLQQSVIPAKAVIQP